VEALQYKIRISILWISFAICSSAGMILWFIEPGILKQIMTTGEMAGGKLTEGTIISFTLWWLIPLIMSFLTQTLNYLLNRWINIFLGIICALAIAFYLIRLLTSEWFNVANFLILIFIFVVSVLIALHAWKLPREEM
jgi:hypothetical protein